MERGVRAIFFFLDFFLGDDNLCTLYPVAILYQQQTECEFIILYRISRYHSWV